LFKSERTLYLLMLVILCSLAVAGVIIEGWENLPGKFLLLQTRSALLNVASVGFLGLVLVYFEAINLCSPTLALIMTMMGFSFFGNTLYNSASAIIGVFLATSSATAPLHPHRFLPPSFLPPSPPLPVKEEKIEIDRN